MRSLQYLVVDASGLSLQLLHTLQGHVAALLHLLSLYLLESAILVSALVRFHNLFVIVYCITLYKSYIANYF